MFESLDPFPLTIDWRAASLRSFTAIRKEAGLSCGSFLRKSEVVASVGSIQNLKDLKVDDRNLIQPLTASHLHCTAGSSSSFTAIRKNAGLFCGSRLRSVEVFAYVGLPQNLKDQKKKPLEGPPFRHSPRAICTVLLDPRDPLL